MHFAIRIACSLCFPIVLSGCATSDIITRSVVSDLRASISESGSPEAKKADKWVELFIPYHHSLLAGVAQRPDGPIIIFTSGYQELLSNVAEVSVAVQNRDPALALCRDKYAARLERDWIRVIKESGGNPIRQNTNPTWMTRPSTFFKATSFSECRPLTKDLPLKEELHQLRDEIVARAVSFIYLHEIGHIVMGKTPEHLSRVAIAKKTDEEKKDALIERRQREYMADELAAKEFIRLYADPMQLFNSSLFADSFQVYGAWSCSREPKSTHPAGDRRTAKVMQYFLDNVVKAGKPDASATVMKYMRDYIKKTNLRLQHENCPKV